MLVLLYDSRFHVTLDFESEVQCAENKACRGARPFLCCTKAVGEVSGERPKSTTQKLQSLPESRSCCNRWNVVSYGESHKINWCRVACFCCQVPVRMRVRYPFSFIGAQKQGERFKRFVQRNKTASQIYHKTSKLL